MSIERVVELANLLGQQQDRVTELEADLKAAKKAMFQTQTEDLPTLMSEIGLSELALKDGIKVVVEEDVKCGITEANKPMALAWLARNGYGGLIKTSVTVDFTPEERDKAVDLADSLSEQYPNIAAKEAVHAGTLKSFVKERMAENEEIPFDLFGIHPFNKATIKKGN